MSSTLDRNLTKSKNEAEELMQRVERLISTIQIAQITPEEKNIFSIEFSKLANDVTSLNETVLNSIVNDNVDLESFVIAPERLGKIDLLNLLIVDKETLKLEVKEEDVQMQNEDALEFFDEGEEFNNKVKGINDIVSNSLDIFKRISRSQVRSSQFDRRGEGEL